MDYDRFTFVVEIFTKSNKAGFGGINPHIQVVKFIEANVYHLL